MREEQTPRDDGSIAVALHDAPLGLADGSAGRDLLLDAAQQVVARLREDAAPGEPTERPELTAKFGQQLLDPQAEPSSSAFMPPVKAFQS